MKNLVLFIYKNFTPLGSGLDRLLGVIARSESVVAAEEAALDADNFRERALG